MKTSATLPPTENAHAGASRQTLPVNRLSELAGRLVRDRSRRAARSRWRWLRGVGILLALVGLVLLWLATRPPTVDVATVGFQRVGPAANPILRATGYIAYPNVAILQTTARTPAVALHAEEGDFVRRGAVLARFDIQELAARERLQQVVLEDAVATGSRAGSLQAGGAASEADVQAARTAMERAEADLGVTRASLAAAVLRAPFDGLVTRRLISVGEIPTQGAYEFVDVSRTYVDVDVTQDEISRVVPGAPVVVSLDAFPDREYAAHVSRVSPRADPSKNTVPVRVEVETPDDRFRPDLSARVFFVSEGLSANGPITAVLALEKSLIETVNGEARVWRVDDGRIRRTPVEIGRDLGEAVEITAGLSENDQVVRLAGRTLHDGMRVSVRTGP